MPRFAANLSMMYNEHAFLDRFAKAARDGFKGVEYLFPYDHPAEEIRALLDANGLEQVLFNAPPGDWAAGERGIASLPGREAECREGVAKALEYAVVLGNKLLHVMAGIPKAGDADEQRATYLRNIAHAADQAAPLGITVLMEPINRRDMPGYFLDRQDAAHAIRTELGRANVKVQFDAYHAQITEGDLATKLRRDIADIGHIQVASVPDRHEPDDGEVNYPYLFGLIDQLGYAGWIGCEYRPAGETDDGLDWLAPWRRG
jgi:hydroxypyruvate isomerase